MTRLELLKYAYHGALEVWCHENDRFKKRPDDKILKARVEAADEAFEEIRNMLMAEETKEAGK